MAKSPYVIRECFYCGPRRVVSQASREQYRHLDAIPCPTCGLDPAEVREIEKVVARRGER